MPNSEPTLFFPSTLTFEAPHVWKWVKRHALHYEKSYYRMGWNVWLPLAEDKEAA